MSVANSKISAVSEAEDGLIGSALMYPTEVVPKAIEAGVLPDWFVNETWRAVWAAVLDEFTASGVPGDLDNGEFVLAVLDRAKKNSARPKSPTAGVEVRVDDLQNAMDCVATSAHVNHHLSILRSEAMLRRLGLAQTQFHKDLREVEVPDAIGRLNSRLTQILADSMGAKQVPVSKLIDSVLGEYREARRIRIDEKRLDYTPGIPLPWPIVNLKANGVQAGLYYVGARPSVGKTAFVLNFIRFWCEKGIKVGFDSLDMATLQLLKRPLGEMSRVSFNKASFGTTTQEDVKAMEAAAAKIRDWPLALVDFRDVDQLRAWSCAMRSVKRLDVLVVDFVQLLRASRHFSNSEERIEYVSGVLKSIAIDLQIPVIALSQLNRECEKDGGRVPTASDLRGSGALEQDAFAVWILHRDKEVKAQWDTVDSTGRSGAPLGLTPGFSQIEFKGIDPVRFIIAKNQNGQAGPDVWFPFVFYKKYCCIMLGDVDAQPIVKTTGYGVSARETADYAPKYARVHADWRHDALEAALRTNRALIEEDLDAKAAPSAPSMPAFKPLPFELPPEDVKPRPTPPPPRPVQPPLPPTVHTDLDDDDPETMAALEGY